jgi:hypothetical protein
MIVRDMNRVGRGIMSDRREYTTNENILGYIYQKPGTIVSNPEWTDTNATIKVDEEELFVLELPELPKQEVVTQVDPVVSTLPAVEPIKNPAPVDRTIDLDLIGLSPDAQHFLSQWDIKVITDLSTVPVGAE